MQEDWHTDSTYMPVSSKMAMLAAEKVPPSGGGETGFAVRMLSSIEMFGFILRMFDFVFKMLDFAGHALSL